MDAAAPSLNEPTGGHDTPLAALLLRLVDAASSQDAQRITSISSSLLPSSPHSPPLIHHTNFSTDNGGGGATPLAGDGAAPTELITALLELLHAQPCGVDVGVEEGAQPTATTRLNGWCERVGTAVITAAASAGGPSGAANGIGRVVLSRFVACLALRAVKPAPLQERSNILLDPEIKASDQRAAVFRSPNAPEEEVEAGGAAPRHHPRSDQHEGNDEDDDHEVTERPNNKGGGPPVMGLPSVPTMTPHRPFGQEPPPPSFLATSLLAAPNEASLEAVHLPMVAVLGASGSMSTNSSSTAEMPPTAQPPLPRRSQRATMQELRRQSTIPMQPEPPHSPRPRLSNFSNRSIARMSLHKAGGSSSVHSAAGRGPAPTVATEPSLAQFEFRFRPAASTRSEVSIDAADVVFTSSAQRAAEEGDVVVGGFTINQYLLVQNIGRGVQGEVYLAFDTANGKELAVKIIPRPLKLPAGTMRARQAIAANRDLQQVYREVRVMKQCRHRNLIALYEVIDDPKHDELYLVMQLARNGCLLKVNAYGEASRTVDIETAVDYGQQLCGALRYLHRHGIVHQDIKPENVLVGDGDRVFLSDFGVSRVLSDGDDVRQQGTLVFLPPEAMRGRAAKSESGHGSSTETDGGARNQPPPRHFSPHPPMAATTSSSSPAAAAHVDRSLQIPLVAIEQPPSPSAPSSKGHVDAAEVGGAEPVGRLDVPAASFMFAAPLKKSHPPDASETPHGTIGRLSVSGVMPDDCGAQRRQEPLSSDGGDRGADKASVATIHDGATSGGGGPTPAAKADLVRFAASVRLVAPNSQAAAVAVSDTESSAPSMGVGVASATGPSIDPAKADVWALGLTLYTMVEGRLPWPPVRRAEGGGAEQPSAAQAMHEYMTTVAECAEVPLGPCVLQHPRLASILAAMLAVDPARRCSAAVAHECFRQLHQDIEDAGGMDLLLGEHEEKDGVLPSVRSVGAAPVEITEDVPAMAAATSVGPRRVSSPDDSFFVFHI